MEQLGGIGIEGRRRYRRATRISYYVRVVSCECNTHNEQTNPNAQATRCVQASVAIHESLRDRDARDKILLGAAGLAVAAALGIAYQRR